MSRFDFIQDDVERVVLGCVLTTRTFLSQALHATADGDIEEYVSNEWDNFKKLTSYNTTNPQSVARHHYRLGCAIESQGIETQQDTTNSRKKRKAAKTLIHFGAAIKAYARKHQTSTPEQLELYEQIRAMNQSDMSNVATDQFSHALYCFVTDPKSTMVISEMRRLPGYSKGSLRKLRENKALRAGLENYPFRVFAPNQDYEFTIRFDSETDLYLPQAQEVAQNK